MANKEEIVVKVKDLISQSLGVSPDEIVASASFIDDLGADSLDIVELVIDGVIGKIRHHFIYIFAVEGLGKINHTFFKLGTLVIISHAAIVCRIGWRRQEKV